MLIGFFFILISIKQIGMLQAELINEFCQVPCGAAAIAFLTNISLTDRMDSFYLRFA